MEFSYIGYKTHEILVGSQTIIDIELEADAVEMDEVVIKALNIQRDKESLGYSVSQVSAAEVNVAKENNVMNSLSGKVSGLQISHGNTGVDGSSRILLRGVSTINGSNRPLVVVDGIPITGDAGGGSQYGGVDRGDALSDINPDDVESISVLKGAGAAALYGSFAKVGNDTSPYRTQAVYNVDQTVTLPYTVGSIPSSLPSFNLRPESSESWEVGAELGFFNNRLQFDFTYYQTTTKDQIMAVPISGATGFESTVINAGVVSNKGYEFQVNAVPFESNDFTWDLGFNFTKSNSTVESLNEGLESITLNSLWHVSVEARPGEEFGSIYGYDYLRDNFGRKLITNDGYAQKGERIKLGSMTPDWYGGITNKFRYKNFSISSLISIQQGGEFYSYGRAYRTFFGTDARSLEGRETGYVMDGINENTGFVNDTPADTMLTHYSNIFTNEVATDQVLDASNVKFKELVLTYHLPSSLLRNTFIESGSISAVGRDLFFIYNAAGDIDPESGYSSGPTGGALEHSSLPSTRSYGLNLKINF